MSTRGASSPALGLRDQLVRPRPAVPAVTVTPTLLPDAAARAATAGKVLVLTGSVGEGHDGAARELARRLRARGIGVEVRDYLDALPVVTRWMLRDLYRPVVQHVSWLYDGILERVGANGPVHRAMARLCRDAQDDVAAWAQGADFVVTTFPLAAQTVGDLRRSGRLAVPAATYLTDPSVHAVWCHPAVDHHLAVTTATALDAARHGVQAVTSGPLSAHLRDGPPRPRAQVRLELGCSQSAPVVLISAGSLGMGDVHRSVRDLLADPRLRVVVLCGRNVGLRRRLSRLPRVVALGWRDDVPAIMGAVDVLVHNAGGLSLTEALAIGLPVLTYRPIPGHGRANAHVLEAAGIAPWPRTPADLLATISHLGRGTAARTSAEGDLWPLGADPAEAVAELLTAARRAAAESRRATGDEQP